MKVGNVHLKSKTKPASDRFEKKVGLTKYFSETSEPIINYERGDLKDFSWYSEIFCGATSEASNIFCWLLCNKKKILGATHKCSLRPVQENNQIKGWYQKTKSSQDQCFHT